MHHAKVTCDEIKAFYSARAAIEDEYARKLLALTKKPLGNGEGGTLRISLDTIRREVENMAKAHQTVANQMKGELDEQLTVNAGGLKERRKVIQTGIEKLYKQKQAQTSTLNKARDKYEQDCLKVKGYTAQGHMVMGQEERRNKQKLEKTYAQMATTSGDYRTAVTALEETTGRWNREWKNACDKFQDLEEERIDYLKSSLWNFANISSTVCVTDDQACENIRLSLEKCDVEEDIMTFIKIQGTGQDIPDPPRFIDFCREDAEDAMSEISESRPAQFPRAINPAIRPGAVSPQPSMLDSHHDTDSKLAQEMRLGSSPAQAAVEAPGSYHKKRQGSSNQAHHSNPYAQPSHSNSWANVSHSSHSQAMMAPDDDYGRSDPPPLNASEMTASSLSRVSHNSSQRPESRDSESDYSQSSVRYDQPSGNVSPIKQSLNDSPKKSPWFKSPFGRHKQQVSESRDHTPTPVDRPQNRNTWGPTAHKTAGEAGPTRPGLFGRGSLFKSHQRTASPEPMEPGAKTQLNIGENVFDVTTDPYTERSKSRQSFKPTAGSDEPDLLEQALADLAQVTDKGGHKNDNYNGWGSTNKAARDRDTADHHAGMYTPQPGMPGAPLAGSVPTPFAAAQHRGTPPPAYNRANAPPVGHLGAPPAAHTSKDMQATKNRYVNQRRSVYDDGGHNGAIRATSPAPMRATSPRPPQGQTRPPSSQGYQRAASPNPYGGERPRGNTGTPQNGSYHSSQNGSWQSRNGSPGNNYMMSGANGMPRATSPQPGYYGGAQSRPVSRGPVANAGGDMAVQLHQGASDYSGSMRNRGQPQSQYYAGGDDGMSSGQVSTRMRSKSAASGAQYTKDGRKILHFGKCFDATSIELQVLIIISSRNVHVSSANTRRTRVRKGRHVGCPTAPRRRLVGSRDCWQEQCGTWSGAEQLSSALLMSCDRLVPKA